MMRRAMSVLAVLLLVGAVNVGGFLVACAPHLNR